MKKSEMMTLRIEPALLSELRKRAAAQGRSLSAEVVHLIKQATKAPSAPSRQQRTSGMFDSFDAPGLAELKRARRDFRARLERAIGRTGDPGAPKSTR